MSDTALVENLETTKRTAAEIQQKVAEAKITSEKIDEAREHYRPAAARASLLYFILNELNTINLVYQFSLKVNTLVWTRLKYTNLNCMIYFIEICRLSALCLTTPLKNRYPQKACRREWTTWSIVSPISYSYILLEGCSNATNWYSLRRWHSK